MSVSSECCVLSGVLSLRQADPSPKGVLPTMVCYSVNVTDMTAYCLTNNFLILIACNRVRIVKFRRLPWTGLKAIMGS
jgi:hypothetical protein